MAFQEEDNRLHQNPQAALLLDGLYCEEECVSYEDNNCFCVFDDSNEVYARKDSTFTRSLLQEEHCFCEDDELMNLISKEKDTHFSLEYSDQNVLSNGSLMVAHKEAVDWILRVKAHYGFTALTCVLAVNYFDRFVLSINFTKDKPWTHQLAAVACLSLAAKVDETQVPLLLDLQVEEAKYVFEAKTIKRMELLVLSTLQWRMNPVTPISFFDQITMRLRLKNCLNSEFICGCEGLLLRVLSDSRFLSNLPSVLAAAVMLHVIKELEPCCQVEYQKQLMFLIKFNKDKVSECYKLIGELADKRNQSCKRKHPSKPSSPSGVIDVYLSCDSSNDSWNESTVSSAPMPRFKRSRAQDQQMRLPSLNRTFVDLLGSPNY